MGKKSPYNQLIVGTFFFLVPILKLGKTTYNGNRRNSVSNISKKSESYN